MTKRTSSRPGEPGPAGPRDQGLGPEADPGERGPTREDYTRVARGPFADVLPERALARGRYTVRDQLVDLRRIPQRPRKVFNVRHLLVLTRRLVDLFGNRPTRFGRLWSRVNRYPYPFRRVSFTSFDGTRIAGWLALQPTRRPGVVVVPGLFSSKDDSQQRRKALKFWRRWSYNVLVIDMRGFGQSEDAPNTPGWKEAEDVLAAARFLDAFNAVDRVAVTGESLGGTAALLAAAQEGLWEEEAHRIVSGRAESARQPRLAPRGGVRAEAFGLRDPAPAGGQGEVGAQQVKGAAARAKDVKPASVRPPASRRVIGAVFAVSPFAESRPAVAHLDRVPPRSFRFRHSVHRIFLRLLRAKTEGRHSSFLGYMEESARHYGVPVEELYARSDLTRVVAHIRAPTLVLHAEDDDLVPLMHADRLGRLVRDRDDVAVWILRWGRHVEFDVLDRRWYWRVLSRFMGQWVGR